MSEHALVDPPWEHLTEQNVRLLVTGAGSAALTVACLAALRRTQGVLVGIGAPALAFFLTDRWSWPDRPWQQFLAVVVVGGLAGAGFERLASTKGSSWLSPLVFLACSGGVWLGVPETSPVITIVGVLLGLLLLDRAVDRGVGYGLGLALSWTVMVGARPSGWSFDGGLLCLAPLAVVPVVAAVANRGGRWPAWPAHVVTSAAIAFAAARWVAVAPDATWTRVAAIAIAAAVPTLSLRL